MPNTLVMSVRVSSVLATSPATAAGDAFFLPSCRHFLNSRTNLSRSALLRIYDLVFILYEHELGPEVAMPVPIVREWNVLHKKLMSGDLLNGVRQRASERVALLGSVKRNGLV